MAQTESRMTKEQVVDELAEIYETILELNLRVRSITEMLEKIQSRLETIPESPGNIS